jgi:cytochrome P450
MGGIRQTEGDDLMSEQNHDPLSLTNLSEPEVRANPYSLYAKIRSQDPVHWDEIEGFWTLTRYDDVVSTLRDKQRFSKARGLKSALNRLPDEEREVAKPVFDVYSRQMLFADPPYHTQLRGLVNKAFTPRIVARMEPHIQEVVDKMLDDVQESGRMDIIADLAYPLPATVILELLGLPIEERDQFKEWSDDFMATLGVVRHNPKVFEVARKSVGDLTDYICDRRDQLLKDPQDDLLSELVIAEDQGNKLNRHEVVANSILLLVAGHETTTNLIGNGLLALMRHPDQMQKLKDDPSLIDSAVDELMRYDNPVQILWRVAKEDLKIGGKQIKEGQFVNVLVGAANRDPAHFPEPDRLDIEREAGRQVGFGLGMHYCVGAPLARLEGRIAIKTVLRRMPNLRLESEDLTWQENPILRGLESLPVAF